MGRLCAEKWIDIYACTFLFSVQVGYFMLIISLLLQKPSVDISNDQNVSWNWFVLEEALLKTPNNNSYQFSWHNAFVYDVNMLYDFI